MGYGVETTTRQQTLAALLKANKADHCSGPTMKTQLIGVAILILLFLIFFIIQIIVPMFFSGVVKGAS